MSAVAGPGPSTMASSTLMVPTSARTKVKKRVINLVNPADPLDFSAQSISPLASPNNSAESIEEEKPDTPPLSQAQTSHTFHYTPGVKGILRSTGTPGSGNGVRFFPKNKFRIITPNASIHQPKPPPSPTNSFFSQLLAVTIPSISSPRRSSVVDKADESWEVPGQEGEISLIASSTMSDGDRSGTVHNWDEQVDEREIEDSIDASFEGHERRDDSWNGEPNIHCSPLALPEDENVSKEISMISFNQQDENIDTEEREMPSADLDCPEDMSNLLSTRFQPEESSFSITDPPSTSTIATAPARDMQILSPVREDVSTMSSNADHTEDQFWNAPTQVQGQVPVEEQEMSISSERSQGLDELSNPTIRRSEMINQGEGTVDSPTPIGRPYNTSSIFADMSAEQADLTWPLTRRAEEEGLSSNFTSPARTTVGGDAVQTPRALGGDVTQFFDTTMTMSFSSPSPCQAVGSPGTSASNPTPTSTATMILRHSPTNEGLIIPTQKMLEAQLSHTSALKAELELYKDLAKKLQSEVSERDGCLARVNLRALDAEVLHNQVKDLERELRMARKSRSPSPLPSPSPTLRAGLRAGAGGGEMSDRTMVAQNEAKELEIRLAKTTADSQDMVRRLAETQATKDDLEKELHHVRDQMMGLEERERDRSVKDQATLEEMDTLRRDLQDAQSQIEHLENNKNAQDEIDRLQEELDEARQKIQEIESAEDEVHALKAELESAHAQLDEYEGRPDLTAELEEARSQLEEAQHEIEHLREQGEEIDALHAELRSAQDKMEQLSEVDNTEIQKELDRANEKIADLKFHVKELTEARLVDEDEIEKLLSQVDKYQGYRKSEEGARKRLEEVERRFEIEQKRRIDAEKKLEEEERFVHELEKENDELRGQLEDSDERVSRSNAGSSSNTSSSPSSTSTAALRDEINKLRSESASKDLEIMNLQRRKAELKEDREMLNIALDSKQQEVELMKRKFSVKGIAGSTPLATSRKINTNTNANAGTKTNAQMIPDTPSTMINSTPLPAKGGVQTRNRRRSSLALAQTPLPSVPTHTPSYQSQAHAQAQTPMNKNGRYGIQLHPSTRVTNRVMRKVEEEENIPPRSYASLNTNTRARERMLA
ncbi:uncharacterized protein I303_106207 [Kwoniella dejecticola CBS 10117]|uniref:Uncharacterized protein n=1 Tax=Kwoniella dejecticola CBS 10117 TaxID=1296121 RepID=A0A1A6A1K5_9TREE|nr:uncharacterized protein I303_06226 [Kwoniella dejecticola CBS 10117]OBR83939.1 hypothetical protein I303_06226 [Kwoniella dejecticola CBS 10117]